LNLNFLETKLPFHQRHHSWICVFLYASMTLTLTRRHWYSTWQK